MITGHPGTITDALRHTNTTPARTAAGTNSFTNSLGADYAPDSNVVDRHIRTLRVKLHNCWRGRRFIATVPGRGYRFLPVVSEHSVAS